MTPLIAADLAGWLETATKGLPADVQAVVRAEIEAHYADAMSDHQASGKTAEEAHRAAMADLGDVRVAARALRDTHLARQRYMKALAVSAWPPPSSFCCCRCSTASPAPRGWRPSPSG